LSILQAESIRQNAHENYVKILQEASVIRAKAYEDADEIRNKARAEAEAIRNTVHVEGDEICSKARHADFGIADRRLPQTQSTELPTLNTDTPSTKNTIATGEIQENDHPRLVVKIQPLDHSRTKLSSEGLMKHSPQVGRL